MKYTLIIDGHNFLFRSLYVLPQKKNKKLLSDKESKDLFVSKLEQNLNAVIREMEPLVDRCILTLDSRSWRNDLKTNVEYKGTRKQDEAINWLGFDECVTQFIKFSEKFNIILSKTKLTEADDLIFMWSNMLSNKGIPVIIYTSDRDMLQLVCANASGADVILWSDVTKKIYIPKDFDKLAKNDSGSFMEMFSKGCSAVDIYDRFANLEQSIRKRKLEKIETDCVQFIYNKVLVGDKSDNISSVYSYEKNGRTYNVTDAKAEKIIDKFIEKTGALNPEFLFIEDTLAVLAESCVEIISGAEQANVLENIKRNIKYLVLSKRVIPEGVLERMTQDIKALAKTMKRIDFSKVSKSDEPVIKISENIFKGVDSTDMSFIKKPEKSLF